ncbi:MAG: ABC transporter permease subunit, partial [Oscillospiraceae bacterium]|nr:ABC transporter permease subunit [Oscillospiraceae bacterium]
IEAARIEGANEWKIFWKIVLPQARPGVSSLIILTLIDCCSMIEQPFMLLKEKTQYPMSIMLKYLSESTIEYAFVLSVIFVFPLFLISFILQEELLTGIGFTVPQKVKK